MLDQRDGRRAIGNGREAPGQAAADAAQRGGAVALDDEAALLDCPWAAAALRIGLGGFQARPCARRRRRTSPVRAHHQMAADRHRHRRLRPARSRPAAGPAASPAGGRYRPAASTQASMRKLAGVTTPCQSKAAATRLKCSPPAAKKVATTRISTSARSAIGSRSASRGDGQPALNLRADISARSTWARQSACETGSCSLAAIWSRTAVAGRCRSPLTRSSRRRPSCTLGSLQPHQRHGGDQREQGEQAKADGARRAAAARSRGRPRKRRGTGRARSASIASAGHSRSHSRLPRARRSARASKLPDRRFPVRTVIVQAVQQALRRPGFGVSDLSTR